MSGKVLNYRSNRCGGLPLTVAGVRLYIRHRGRMKDIHEVLRQKQTRYAQLGKQIEMLQQAAEKLREVAPLLAEMTTKTTRC